jgi:hypothetical protein
MKPEWEVTIECFCGISPCIHDDVASLTPEQCISIARWLDQRKHPGMSKIWKGKLSQHMLETVNKAVRS